MFQFTIGFIGMGNMGYAMLGGLRKDFREEELLFSESNVQRAEDVSAMTKVQCALGEDVARYSKMIVLAIKPVSYPGVLKAIRPLVQKEQIIVSIAPNFSIAKIKEALGEDVRVVRAMPNTPAMVGEGMTGICYDEKAFSLEEVALIEQVFSAFGRFVKVEERMMPTIVALSGSSPAYAYMFIDALADAGVKYGLSKKESIRVAAQALLGSAKMVLESEHSPADLKDMVCSPAGTTIEAVVTLEEQGFRNAILKAADACVKKCS